MNLPGSLDAAFTSPNGICQKLVWRIVWNIPPEPVTPTTWSSSLTLALTSAHPTATNLPGSLTAMLTFAKGSQLPLVDLIVWTMFEESVTPTTWSCPRTSAQLMATNLPGSLAAAFTFPKGSQPPSVDRIV